MITGCLQQKNGYYYALLYLKVNSKRKVKWIATKLPVAGTSERKARKAFDEIRMQYEREEEERLQREAQEEAMFKGVHPDAIMDYAEVKSLDYGGMRLIWSIKPYLSATKLLRLKLTENLCP